MRQEGCFGDLASGAEPSAASSFFALELPSRAFFFFFGLTDAESCPSETAGGLTGGSCGFCAAAGEVVRIARMQIDASIGCERQLRAVQDPNTRLPPTVHGAFKLFSARESR